MANVASEFEIDWMACELIEKVPGKVSGKPIVRGTRIMPDAILNSYELGDSMMKFMKAFPPCPLSRLSG